MQYVRLTFQYMRKAFLILAAVNLPAAVVLGIFTRPMRTLTFLPEYLQTAVSGFWDTFWLIFGRDATTKVYPVILVFLLLLLGVCVSFSLIEKHMRVGKLHFTGAVKQINSYFLPVLIMLAILAVLTLVYSLLQTGMLTLLHFIISGNGKPVLAGVIVSAAVALVLFVLAVAAFCSTVYLASMMTIYGYSFRDGYAAAFRLTSHNTGGIVAGLLFPTLLVAVVRIGLGFVPMPLFAFQIIGCVLYLFLLVYLVSFIMVSLFDLSGMERRDCKRHY